jgi:hypothetical protein
LLYLELAVQFYVQTHLTFGAGRVLGCVCLLTFLIGFPLGCGRYLYKNRACLSEAHSMLFKDLSLKRSNQVIYNFPVSLLRRFVFIMLPLAFDGVPAF